MLLSRQNTMHFSIPRRTLMRTNFQEKFPHGPRYLSDDTALPLPAPRNLQEPQEIAHSKLAPPDKNSSQNSLKVKKRRRRSVVVSDRKVRSADVGVSSLYEVISEADLAFSPDSRAEAVTVFQGKIREEVVYGICMPVPGFSVLFVMVAVSAVVSALVAGSLLYRYQLQREQMVEQAQRMNGAVPVTMFANWMGLRILRARHGETSPATATESNGTAVGALPINGKAEDARNRD